MSSKGVNKVILIGNLGQNPEVRYMPNGNAVTNIVIATSEVWRDKQTGETKEKTEWHRVVIFGKIAEIAGEYLYKGSQVYIEGSLQTRKWKDPSGVDKYFTEVIVNINGKLQILNNRNQKNKIIDTEEPIQIEDVTKNNVYSSQSLKKNIINKTSQMENDNNDLSDFDDDIPF